MRPHGPDVSWLGAGTARTNDLWHFRAYVWTADLAELDGKCDAHKHGENKKAECPDAGSDAELDPRWAVLDNLAER